MVILTSKQYDQLYSLICSYSNAEFIRGMNVSVFGVNSSTYDNDKEKSDRALKDIIHFVLEHSYDTDKVSYRLNHFDLPFPSKDCDNLHRVIYEDDGNMTQFDEDWGGSDYE